MSDPLIEIRFGGSRASWQRLATIIAGIAAFCWFVVRVPEIWLPIVLSFLFAMVLDPVVDRMESRGLSRTKSATLIFLAVFGLCGATLFVGVPVIVDQSRSVGKSLQPYLPSSDVKQTRRSLSHLLQKVHASPYFTSVVENASAEVSKKVASLGSVATAAARIAATNAIWLIFIPIASFYALRDYHLIYARFLLLVPAHRRVMAQHIVNEVTSIFVRYLRGLAIVCAINGAVTALMLLVLRVPDALALGAVSGIMYLVPYLGPLITVGMTAGVCMASPHFTIPMTLGIVALMTILNTVVFDQIVTPRVVGQNVGLHPILSFVALVAGGSLLGIAGMILAVPIAATVQMILVALVPNLARPIDVPAGEQLHEKVEAIEQYKSADDQDELRTAVDVHSTLVLAVEDAERLGNGTDERVPETIRPAELLTPPVVPTAFPAAAPPRT